MIVGVGKTLKWGQGWLVGILLGLAICVFHCLWHILQCCYLWKTFLCFLKTYRNIAFLSGKSINFCPHFFLCLLLRTALLKKKKRTAFYTLKSDKYSPIISISFMVFSFTVNSLILLESLLGVFLKTSVCDSKCIYCYCDENHTLSRDWMQINLETFLSQNCLLAVWGREKVFIIIWIIITVHKKQHTFYVTILAVNL